jgi:hypothetical protein
VLVGREAPEDTAEQLHLDWGLQLRLNL